MVGVFLVALIPAACSGTTVSDSPDPEAVAETFCEWLFRCGNPFEEDYSSVQQCQEVELYRHASPDTCATANADFKDCLSQLTCEEAEDAWQTIEPLLTRSDAEVPDEDIPCGLDLVFYIDACSRFECDDGEIINRRVVCDGRNNCDDRSDERGCP